MNAVVRFFAAAVRRAPVAVVVVTLAATAGLAVLIPQRERADLVEAFAPSSPEFLALERIGTDLGGAETTVEVVITSPSGDVITASGLRASHQVEQRVRAAAAAAYLSTARDNPIAGYFTPVLTGLGDLGIAPQLLDDATVKEAFSIAWESVDTDTRDGLRGLMARDGTDLDAPTTPAGLLLVRLVFPDGMEDQAVGDLLQDLEDQLVQIDEPGVEVGVFARSLLRAGRSIQQQINQLMRNAAIIIVLILLFVLWVSPGGRISLPLALRRTGADVAIAAGTTLMAILWVMGAEVLLGPRYLGLVGRNSSITQIVPVLLIGLGVDYAIHMTARYREELGEGSEPAEAARRAGVTVGVALVLGAVTTAVGFATNLASPIPTLQDFGVLAALGILGAFFLMLTFAPAVRVLADRRAGRAGPLPAAAAEGRKGGPVGRLAERVGMVGEHHPILIVGAALLLAGAGTFGLTRLETEFDLTSFVPDDAPALDTLEVLEAQFGGGLGEQTYVVAEGAVTTPAAHNALVDTLDALAGVPGVVVFGGRAAADAPATALQQASASSPSLAAQAGEAGLGADLRADPDADLSALYAAALEVSPEAFAAVYDPGNGDRRPLVAIRITTQAGGAIAQLTADLSEAAAALQGVDGVTAVITSNRIVQQDVAESLSSSQLISVSITLVVAAAVLVLVFWVRSRRPLLGVVTILPVVLVVLWTYGMMEVVGIPFSPTTAMVAAIAIGVGVDYSIHIVHRFQEDRERRPDREAALRSTLRHTGGALTGAALTTLAGFGILTTSTLEPFRHLGAVVVFALSFSLLAAVIVLPGMLVLWDRSRRSG